MDQKGRKQANWLEWKRFKTPIAAALMSTNEYSGLE
jgi:hypothetical protein